MSLLEDELLQTVDSEMNIANEERHLEWGIEPTIEMDFEMDSEGDTLWHCD